MIRLVALLLIFTATLRGADASPEFDNANRLYEKGDFNGAAAAYRKLISGGQASAAIWFNLGNASFKIGRPGQAIAAYRKAQALAPRDPDIRANLRFARESVPGNMSRAGALDRLMRILTVREASVLSTALLWVWLGLLSLGALRPKIKNSLAMWQAAAGTLALTFAAYYWSIVLYQNSNRTAVVTAAGTTAVRFGPVEESQTSYTVRDGAELRLIGRKDAWLQVTDSSARVGWLPAHDAEEVPF